MKPALLVLHPTRRRLKVELLPSGNGCVWRTVRVWQLVITKGSVGRG
jgi:hypothetical protein